MNLTKNQKEALSKVNVIIGERVNRSNFSSTTLENVIDTITSDKIKEKVTTLRSFDDKDQRQQYKLNNLPFFTIGEFSDNLRQKRAFIRTQYAIYDYDHLGGSFDSTLEKIKNSKNVIAAFRSPSGDGIKVICKFNREITDADEFTSLYKYYAKQFSIDLGEEADKTSDVSRACFFSHDPSMYINIDAEPLDAGIDIPEEIKMSNNINRGELLDKIKYGISSGENRTPTLTQSIGLLMNLGMDREYAMSFAIAWNRGNAEPLDEGKVVYTVNDMYDRYANGSISEKCKNYYSYETAVVEARITGDVFSLRPFGEKKFNVMMDANTKEEKEKHFKYLVKNKHIHNLKRVDHISDINSDQSFYIYDNNECVFTAHIVPKPIKMKDNKFIENYLENTFGEHKEFIKKWLAVFFYTNYKKLPFLIFTGGRTVGKNTFAQAISEMLPTLCDTVEELDGDFNPEGEKKLLIIDEAVSSGKMQYVKLKQMSGKSHVLINQKYVPKYKVRNNLNLIVLSNEDEAITVSREEAPKNEKTNQFFVYKFKEMSCDPDPKFEQKLVDRLGYYIRTELKQVFENIIFDGHRYSIPVPITDEEKKLFQNCISEVEADSDAVIQKMNNDVCDLDFRYMKFIKDGYIPTDYFNWLSIKSTKNKIVKDLQRRGYLKKEPQERPMIGTERFYCYKLGEKWISEIEKSISEING